MKTLHPKVKQLQLRATPINYSAQEVENELEIEDRLVKMYLAVWGVPDSHRTVFLKGCCAKSIMERGPASDAKYKISFLNYHDQRDPLGVFSVLKEDDYGLYAECVVDNIEEADRTLSQIRSGTLNQFSIGFNLVWDKVEYDDKLDLILFKEIELYEGSVVLIGSNSETYAIRSGMDADQERERLVEATEVIIRSLPRNKQLEVRQLIAKHISLSAVEPVTKKLESLRTAPEPSQVRAELYKQISNQIQLFK